MDQNYQTNLARLMLAYPVRMAMPIGVYAGLEMTGASVYDAVTNPSAQAEAVLCIHERYHTPILLTAMDLSAEAETFGCQIRMEKEEIPTVIGRRVQNLEEIEALPVPQPGDKRTAVHLDAAQRLVTVDQGLVLGGIIGPFSLASRIFGVSEALETSMTDPDLLMTLLQRATDFLISYARAFKQVGAAGIIMAEPAAGLLSPRALARFSSHFVRQIVEAVQDESFALLLHNCGAKRVHLASILESGAEIYHFGAPMDIPAALQQVEGKVILCGNLDPTAVFHDGTPAEVFQQTLALLQQTASFQNFVISSGCDLPPHTPVDNMDAFFTAVSQF